jgi:hypothetical protein
VRLDLDFLKALLLQDEECTGEEEHLGGHWHSSGKNNGILEFGDDYEWIQVANDWLRESSYFR